jgi:N-alpha-acetyltransferase 50
MSGLLCFCWLTDQCSQSFLQLRKINTASFPIQYNERFYLDIVERNNESLNKFAYCNEFVVGAVCARVEVTESDPGKQRLYIMTLAVLAAYRGRGIGSELLQSVLDYCELQRASAVARSSNNNNNVSAGEAAPISEIALHVQISNDDAIRFYTEKFGFVQGELVENYYRRIDPPHCYLLYKTL